MRHRRALRKLGRNTAHRLSLLRNLSTSLFEKERIATTLPKAKELRPFAEKLITLARRDDLHSRRMVARSIQDKAVVKKLFTSLGPRFAQRHGGYSRILKLGWRQGDGAEMAILELLGSEPVFAKEGKKGKKGKKKTAPAAEGQEPAAGAHAGHAHEHDDETAAEGKGAAKPRKKEKEKPARAARGKKKPKQ